jgi:hypothetical protein
MRITRSAKCLFGELKMIKGNQQEDPRGAIK